MGKPKRNYSSTLTWQLGHWEIVPLLPFGVSQVSLAFPKIYENRPFSKNRLENDFSIFGKCVELPHHRGRGTSEWFPSWISSTGKLEALFRWVQKYACSWIFMGFSYVPIISKVEDVNMNVCTSAYVFTRCIGVYVCVCACVYVSK